MTLTEANNAKADAAALRRRWDLGLRWGTLPGAAPIWNNPDGLLLLRRWDGKKYDRPLAATAVGFARRPATAVSSAGGVTYAADTVYWHAADVVSGGGLITAAPLDQAQVTVWGAAGWTGLIPNTPLHVGVEQADGGKALVRWVYNAAGEQAAPSEFAVYSDAGSGTIDWSEPIGTVTYYAGQAHYSLLTAALTPGTTYLFNVRAIAATGAASLVPALADGYAGSAPGIDDNYGVGLLIVTDAADDPDVPVFI